MKPKIVVPGHGAIGDIGLVRTTGEYLSRVQALVRTGVRNGLDQDRLIESFKALHPDWDNANYVPHEIAVYYAETTGKPLVLPAISR